MSIVTLRPDGDNNAVWATTGANRFSVLNDNNDATYCTGPSAGTSAYQSLAMGTTTLTATQRIKAIQYQMRYQFLGASYVALRFVRAGDSEAKLAIVQQAAGALAIRTVTSPFFPTDASGQEWNNTTLASLALRLYGSNTNVRVMELWAFVDVRNQPTVATPTVSDNTTSSRPTVAWVYSDSDGDPQAAWHVRIFSAAQFGIAGFDPATSPFTLEMKGSSGADTVTANGDLVNGVSYKAYVRVAKSFGIGGFDPSTRTFVPDLWWSTWVASAQFTEAFEPVPQPALTVAPDNTVPHLRNLLTVDAKLNLLSADDASFETGLGTWVNDANATLVQDATQFLKGTKSMRLTAGIAADMAARTANGATTAYPAIAAQSYRFLASFRAGTTGRSCRVKVRWLDGAAVQIGAEVVGTSVADTNAGWTQATLLATSPAGTALAVVVVEVLAPAAGEQHYVDATSMSTSGSTTWFAGGLSNLDAQLVEFTDWTPSHSVITNILNPQIASAGEAVGGTDGFYVRFAEDRLVLDPSVVAAVTDSERSLRWDVGHAAFSFLDIGAPQGVYEPTYTFPCVPGRAYTFSAYIRALSGSHSGKLFLFPIDQTGAQVGAGTEVNSGTITITTNVTRFSVTMSSVPDGTVGLRGGFENSNGDLTSFFFDALQLEDGSVLTPWQQGQGQIPAWQPVRGAKTALTTDPRVAQSLVWDREAPPGVIRMYRATNQIIYPDGSVGVSPVSTYVQSRLGLLVTATGDRLCILKDPANPAHDLSVRLASLNERISEDLTESHPIRPNQVGGFGQRPVVISDWIGGDDGTLELIVTDEADWYPLKQLLRTKRPLLLQLPEGGQRYIRCKDRSWPRERIGPTPGTNPSLFMRVVAVDYVEVDRPVVLS